MEDRVDPMLTYAMTALAANKQARVAGAARATFGRVEVTPNGTNAVPSRVLAWLDARCSSEDALADAGRDDRAAGDRARRAATAPRSSVTAESVSGAVTFDPDAGRAARRRPRGRRLAGAPDRGRPRRRNPLCCRDSDRDALRPQPDRGLALAGRDRVDAGLPGRRARAGRDPRAAGHVTHVVPARAGLGRRRRPRRRAGRDRGRSLHAGSERRRRPEPDGAGTGSGRASPSPAWPTATATPSTGPCAGAPSASAGRSGPGATRCTTSPGGWTRTPTSPWRGRPTARWSRPGSPRWGSSTTCTTSPTARRTTTPTRWATR